MIRHCHIRLSVFLKSFIRSSGFLNLLSRCLHRLSNCLEFLSRIPDYFSAYIGSRSLSSFLHYPSSTHWITEVFFFLEWWTEWWRISVYTIKSYNNFLRKNFKISDDFSNFSEEFPEIFLKYADAKFLWKESLEFYLLSFKIFPNILQNIIKIFRKLSKFSWTFQNFFDDYSVKLSRFSPQKNPVDRWFLF